jgi:hypothetical protein
MDRSSRLLPRSSQPRPAIGPSADAEPTKDVAQDYDDLADDLENGLIEVRHPELLLPRDR